MHFFLDHHESKLPDVKTTIFTTMSLLAKENNAINLSQGFPDFDCPKLLLEETQRHSKEILTNMLLWLVLRFYEKLL